MSDKMMPEIRFKGFSDDWEQRRLGEVADSFEYGLNARATKFDGENKYIRITDIDDASRKFNQDKLTSPEINYIGNDNYLLKKGDILLARTGASVGKSYRYQNIDGRVYYAGFLIRIRINLNYNPIFIFQNTLTEKYKNFINITSQRSGQPGVNAKEYSRFLIYIPKLDEQKYVGNLFQKLDNTIALHQKKLLTLKKAKDGFLQSIFPNRGEYTPRLRFTIFTEYWEQRKLGEVFIERSDRNNVGELISVTIKYGVIKASELIRKDNSSSNKSNYKIVKKDDIAYNSMRMWQGASGYSVYNGILSPAYTVITPKENVSSEFFAFMFKKNSMIQIFQKNSQGLTSDTWNLKFPALSNIKVEIPSYQEQNIIKDFFKQLDSITNLQQQKIDKLQQIKKAYLQKMFI
ncbi:restriction endonuclease subunit S [Dellaglioa sp. BT-FLS60]